MRISVIVLTLNSEKYIRRCLDALDAQTFREFEVLIVDAGSTDATLAVVDTYSGQLAIRVCAAVGTNMGQARNVGIRAAAGAYLCFCDSDDYYLPAKLSTQIGFLEANPEYGACYYDAYHFQSACPDRRYLRPSTRKSGALLKEFLKVQTININTLMIRRQPSAADILFPDDDAGKYGEDWQYLISLGLAGTSFGFVPGSYSVIEERVDSHTSWNIQHLMKWYVLRHLLANEAGIAARGIPRMSLWSCYALQYAKFIAACSVSGHADFAYKTPFTEGRAWEPVFMLFYRLACLVALERGYFRRLLRWLWLSKRQYRSRPVSVI